MLRRAGRGLQSLLRDELHVFELALPRLAAGMVRILPRPSRLPAGLSPDAGARVADFIPAVCKAESIAKQASRSGTPVRISI